MVYVNTLVAEVLAEVGIPAVSLSFIVGRSGSLLAMLTTANLVAGRVAGGIGFKSLN